MTSEKRFPVFCERFKELRGTMTDQQFAEKLGMSRQTIGFYARGERVPDAVGVRRIADACGVSADWLLGIEPPGISMWEPCGMCGTQNGVNAQKFFGARYCCRCGRPLSESAMSDLLKRIRM